MVTEDGDSNFYDFNTNLKTGAAVTATFFVDDTSSADVKLTGTVLISSVETGTSFDDIARYSITFTGSGSLTVDTNDAS